MDDIANLIDRHPAKQAEVLEELRSLIKKRVPGATERIFYKMPSFEIGGVILISYEGFRAHSSIFPGPAVIELLKGELAPFKVSKGAIQFDAERLPSHALIRKILKTCIDVINSGYPKSSGEFLEFYDNGFLKASGKYKKGEMHGAWSFYRRDGSIMRSGQLAHGQPVGEWTSYPRALSDSPPSCLSDSEAQRIALLTPCGCLKCKDS